MAYHNDTAIFSAPHNLAELVTQHKALTSACDAALQEQEDIRMAMPRVDRHSKVPDSHNLLTAAGQKWRKSDDEKGKDGADASKSAALGDIEELELLIILTQVNRDELEDEIFNYVPRSRDEAILKLRFLSEILLDYNEVDARVAAQLIDECVATLSNNQPVSRWAM